MVTELMEAAIRDLTLEGFNPNQVELKLELEMKYGTQMNTTTITSPVLHLSGEEDVRAICEAFARAYSTLYTPEAAYPEGGIDVETFYLHSWVPQPHFNFTEQAFTGTIPGSHAVKETRPVFWEEFMDFRQTRIYDLELMECGNIIEGPAIVEAEDTTYCIAPGYIFTLDKYRNGIMEVVK